MKALKKLRSVLLLSALLVAGAIATPAANAGVLVKSANDCPTQSTSKPFSNWGDSNNYFLAPGGSFEPGTTAWSLGGGAKVVAGNETYYVHGSSDSKSLYIPQGGYATSPTVCVGLSEPSIRWFSKQKSLLNLTGAMTVEVGFETSLGAVVWAPVVGAGILNPSWSPSLPGVVEASLLPLIGDKTPVQFRFRAVTGNWWIDDVYVDPFSRW
jgi:hypothetical protein